MLKRFLLVTVLALTGTTLFAQSLNETAVAQNLFALDLYGEINPMEGSVAFSPYSVYSALGMTYAGAKENTAAEMLRTLHSEKSGDGFHAAFLDMAVRISDQARSAGYEFLSANSLWVQLGYRLLPSFSEVLTNRYSAHSFEEDFASNAEAKAALINGWVAEKTRNKIADIIQPGALSSSTRLVLVNALYFKGRWQTKFSAARDADFKVHARKTAKVKMMRKKSEYGYRETEYAQVLDLPYSGNAFSMVVILPLGMDISSLEASGYLQGLVENSLNMPARTVDVQLPRFKAEALVVLNDKLKNLGMKDAFHLSTADFSGISGNKDLSIALIVHKALVEVDEEGTTAAAATAVKMADAAPTEADKPVEFKADHPFIFFIRDNATGAILFMGRVTEP